MLFWLLAVGCWLLAVGFQLSAFRFDFTVNGMKLSGIFLNQD